MPRSRKSRPRSRKSRVYLPKPVKGAMGNYSTKDSAAKRHKILLVDVKKNGYATTIRDLNLRATMNKQNPKVHKIMREDMEYLQKWHARGRVSRKSRSAK